MRDIPLPTLKSLATKQLLVLLNDARAFGPMGHVSKDVPLHRANRPQDHGGHANDIFGNPCPGVECYTLQQIKEELATREHVLNKHEARRRRQERARGRGRG